MSKRGIQYVSQEEPSFIKQFKQTVGYKEGPNVDTKREVLPRDESGSESDDEQPTIVVLKKGDLTKEEYDRLKDNNEETKEPSKEENDEPELPDDGKIRFKKPTKKSKDSDLSVSTKKKTDDKTEKTSEKKKSSSKGVKNKQLLSFNDEEEEDV